MYRLTIIDPTFKIKPMTGKCGEYRRYFTHTGGTLDLYGIIFEDLPDDIPYNIQSPGILFLNTYRRYLNCYRYKQVVCTQSSSVFVLNFNKIKVMSRSEYLF